MAQLNLFQTERSVPEPRPASPEFIRKYLNRLLNTAQRAQIMPWSASETQSLAVRFTELCRGLPENEGQALSSEFAAELQRLFALNQKSVQNEGQEPIVGIR